MGALVKISKDVLPGSVLLIGGAGYIGRHIAFELIDNGHDVVILDNLSTGSDQYLPDCPLMVEDILDVQFEHLSGMRGRIEGVIHLAALTDAAESVNKPEAYLRANVYGAIRAIDLASYLGARSFVFSSTAAVYGEPEYLPIDESHPTLPQNPYGWSKLAAEVCLRQQAADSRISLAILRYFNVAGADPELRTGDMREKGENVIHKLMAALKGRNKEFRIFGSDYSTKDGTAVRDYIHVSDLASAHVKALSAIRAGSVRSPLVCNVGYGCPITVKQLVDEFLCQTYEVFGANVVFSDRRPGDVAKSYAENQAITELGWRPRHDALSEIVSSALAWQRIIDRR